MSIFHRKNANSSRDVYSFSGVSRENEQAKSIQANIDLLGYLAKHRNLGGSDVATYLEMCERAGMGVHPRKAEIIQAAGSMGADQKTQVRSTLAAVHIDELTGIIHLLGSADSPTLETVKMIQFAHEESDSLAKAFM